MRTKHPLASKIASQASLVGWHMGLCGFVCMSKRFSVRADDAKLCIVVINCREFLSSANNMCDGVNPAVLTCCLWSGGLLLTCVCGNCSGLAYERPLICMFCDDECWETKQTPQVTDSQKSSLVTSSDSTRPDSTRPDSTRPDSTRPNNASLVGPAGLGPVSLVVLRA